MSNQTQKTPTTPEVIEATVIIDADPNTVHITPKTPGKVKTALRHPIQTIKRHNVVSTALAGLAVGVASTLLYVRADKDEEGPLTQDNPDDNVMDFPVTAD